MHGELNRRLSQLFGQNVTVDGSVTGGCINEAWRASTDGGSVFVKTHAHAPPGMFLAEADGLRELSRAGCRVPEVLAVAEDALILEWIQPGQMVPAVQEAMGRGLAAQHRITAPLSGFDGGHNYIGTTRQPNEPASDPLTFFRDQRLGFQQDLLRRRGRLTTALDVALTRVRDRLGSWLDAAQPCSLLHGDLWGGNAMASMAGEPVLFDPAVYYGFREADLAMTTLFGGFSARFYEAYSEVYPLPAGHEERRDLFNLYHVLNHHNLFGGGYGAQALEMARAYAG